MHNILTDPLIRIDTTGGSRVEASLPDVYAAIMADEVEAFPALRPHQRHPLHAFLVQLGAMAMHRAGVSAPPTDPVEWAALIRALTPDFPDDEPWRLVVDDATRPAFMQPPASSEDKLSEYKTEVGTPDELDMLVTSTNHDLKSAVAVSSRHDDLIFALISLQTSDGYFGAGNHGVSRMNGGLGSRPAFSVTPSTRPGRHVRRDIVVLTERRSDLLDKSPAREGGIGLLWTVPWDGAKAQALHLNALDPLYIEVCRRIRLRVREDGRLRIVRATSKGARVEAKGLKGVTGDPWTPVDRGNGKSLTLGVGGFTYKRMVNYLFDWAPPPILCLPTAAEACSSDTMRLVARGMVRGQGKTEGYYERTVPIRRKLGSVVGLRSGTDDVGQIANDRIEEVGRVQRILSHAIQVFLARGESDSSPENRMRARPWLNRLDEFVDARFFDDLQTEFEADGRERGQVRNAWLQNDDQDGVVDRARQILDEAMDSLPCPEIERYKARVAARGLFEGRIRGANGLPTLFDDGGADDR